MTALVLRADAGARVGLGHLRRVMVVGAEGERRGLTPVYAVPEEARPVLRAAGVPAGRIVAPDQAAAAAGPGGAVVVDTCWAGNGPGTAREVAGLTALGLCVAVIDSLPPHQFDAVPGSAPPALVVTPYLGADILRPPPRAGRWLAGPQMAILDPAYGAPLAPAVPPRVVLTAGGADAEGLTPRLMAALAPHAGGRLAVDVVVGPMFAPATRQAIEGLVAPGMVLHHAPPTIAPLVARAALVAGRFGLIRYEAAALHVPGLYLHLGPDFPDYAALFGAHGIARVFCAPVAAQPAQAEAGFLAAVVAEGARLAAGGTPGRVKVPGLDGRGAARLLDALHVSAPQEGAA